MMIEDRKNDFIIYLYTLLLPSREVAVQVQVLAEAGDPLQRLDLVVHPHHAVAVSHRAHRRLQVG